MTEVAPANIYYNLWWEKYVWSEKKPYLDKLTKFMKM